MGRSSTAWCRGPVDPTVAEIFGKEDFDLVMLGCWVSVGTDLFGMVDRCSCLPVVVDPSCSVVAAQHLGSPRSRLWLFRGCCGPASDDEVLLGVD
ncbi:hypothetical protein F0562_030646 [Nyssa sinensis]|uniref:Uncharacterized protein n=1 Tax=Nyssa sinensis TaxID=561372 RepID=A0A5J5AXH2_9ASTE|nr:hypothetical protein F0562_030646 [Nyssa sinensis]